MLIQGITSAELSGRARVEAEITWEEVDRQPVRLFAEVNSDRAEGFWPDPSAFLTACAVPAWQAGEKRIRIDAEVCPVLRDRLGSIFATLKTWYPELGPSPVIESDQVQALKPVGTETSSFLSCGIDSLATLRLNRTQLPASHPSAIRAVLLVDFIHEYGLTCEESARQAAKRIAIAQLVANDIDVDVVPITTNVLELEPDGNVFSFKWHAAALLFAAHFLSRRFCRVQIASTYDAAHLEPWGSHPMLDPNYSTAHLEVEHAGLHLSRLEKTALVANWPVGLNAIRVCQGENSGVTNCGACEKCIRTMTALVALGKLQDSTAFPATDVTPELLATVGEYGMLYNESQLAFYVEMLAPLRKRGRSDLAQEIERSLEDYRRKRTAQNGDQTGSTSSMAKGKKMILADNQIYGLEVARHDAERYWGQPSNDQVAVRQIEALRSAGATHVIFHSDTFWWLQYYPQLNQHLRERYRCIAESPTAIVFELALAEGHRPAIASISAAAHDQVPKVST